MIDQQDKEKALIRAVFYALKAGCLFPVREPKLDAGVRQWVRWGAMRHLHACIAAVNRERDGNHP